MKTIHRFRIKLGVPNIIGCVGLSWLLVWWLPFVLPKHVTKPLLAVFDLIGPLQWVILVGIVVLPLLAAKRGSKWWLTVTIAGVATWVVLILSIH